jgi:glucokinase
MILAGDIGGTHSRIALFNEENGRLRLFCENIYFSRDHQSLEEIVTIFLGKEGGNVQAACFGIAGPVLHGRVCASNLAWVVDAEDLSRHTGVEPVWLVNDLEAHASGIDDLGSDDLVSLNSAKPGEGNAALIAAGTGLGEAGMYWDGRRRRVFAGEGGHADFAPRNDLEIALHQYLIRKYGHVSCERVLSGPGLKNIYDFLRDSHTEDEPEWLKDEMSRSNEPAALIGKYGLEAKAAICERALDTLIGIYGAEAGNLALKLLATGGVFISGGVAAKILPKLRSPIFLEAFTAKGRMKLLLESIPVKVIINDKVGLLGAARYALTKRTESASPVVAS